MKPQHTMAERLKARALQLDLTPAAIAEAASVNRSFLYDILRGKSSRPSRDKLALVARVLMVETDWLLTGAGDVEGVEPIIDAARNAFVAIRGANARPSMGGGTITSDEDEMSERSYHFRLAWIENELHASPDNLRVLQVRGDSMMPTLHDDDTILVDLARKTPFPPGIFVLHDGLGLVAKRLEHLPMSDPPRLRVSSDNPNYSPYDCLLDEVNIVGRVRWYARKL